MPQAEVRGRHSITSSARARSEGWYLKSDPLCGLCIDDELKLGRLIKWNFGGVFASQYFSDLICRISKRIFKWVCRSWLNTLGPFTYSLCS